jgi:hypothetical protein
MNGFENAKNWANRLCKKHKETVYVLRDSLDEPNEYRVVLASDLGDGPLDNRPIRYSAEWTGTGVHGTRS